MKISDRISGGRKSRIMWLLVYACVFTRCASSLERPPGEAGGAGGAVGGEGASTVVDGGNSSATLADGSADFGTDTGNAGHLCTLVIEQCHIRRQSDSGCPSQKPAPGQPCSNPQQPDRSFECYYCEPPFFEEMVVLPGVRYPYYACVDGIFELAESACFIDTF